MHISKLLLKFSPKFVKTLKTENITNIPLKLSKNCKGLPKNCNFFIDFLQNFENFSSGRGLRLRIPYSETLPPYKPAPGGPRSP